MEVKLALLGFGLVAGFLGAVMSGRLSAAVGLILIPMLFAVLGGFATQIGPMVVSGLKELAPTAAMLIFAILYFGVMIDVGLFNPIVRRVIGAVRGDPLRVTLGTAILALIVSLDGDGATTIMVTVTAFLPVYLKLKMRPMILAVLVMMANMVINIAPWGGPTARAAAALKVDPADIFIPLLPAIACGVLGVIGIAWLMGSAEKRRLAGPDPQPAPSTEGYLVSNAAEGGTTAPEKFFWFNLIDVLKQEHFGPLLHVIRYRAQDLQQHLEQLRATGFGLTLGVHTRIDAIARSIFDASLAGNVYVNRNMIGAVVGVQPFGGHGLSGTGPKAGGPLYLQRFATERVLTVNTAATGGNVALLRMQTED